MTKNIENQEKKEVIDRKIDKLKDLLYVHKGRLKRVEYLSLMIFTSALSNIITVDTDNALLHSFIIWGLLLSASEISV